MTWLAKTCMGILLMGACAPPAETTVFNDQIKYVESPIVGNFLQVSGKNVADDDVFITVTPENTCGCRMTCWLHSMCMSVAVLLGDDGKTYCRLTNKSVTALSIMNDLSATYISWFDLVDGKFHGIKDDGLLYLVPNVKHFYDDAKDFCEQIPGYRLGIFKTPEQTRALLEIHNELNSNIKIDLRTINNEITWGDGTVLTEAQTGHIIGFKNNDAKLAYRVREGNYDDYLAADDEDVFICQANPLNLE